MGHKQKLKDGFEWDWTSQYRKKGWLKFNPGVGRYIKRKMAKRDRRAAKQQVKLNA